MLENAKAECASEALEIAAYDAIEALAEAVGDDAVAALARAHRTDDERMVADLRARSRQLDPRPAARAAVASRGDDRGTAVRADAVARSTTATHADLLPASRPRRPARCVT